MTTNVIQVKFGQGGGRCTPEEMAWVCYDRADAIDEDDDTAEEAAELYHRAIELKPDFAVAYVNLGNIHYRRGEVITALSYFNQALSWDPEMPEAHYNIGYVMVGFGEYEHAIEHLARSIEQDPDFPDANFNMAVALQAVGRDREATVYWDNYLRLEPNGAWAEIARRRRLRWVTA